MAQAYKGGDSSGTGTTGPGARFRRQGGRPLGDRGYWRRGIVLAVLAILLALVMLLHAQIPNTVGNLGSLIETFLPWLGVFIPVLLVLGLVRRSATAVIAVLAPAIVWFNLFGGLLTDKTGSGGDLTVVTHNVNAENSDPAGTAKDVAASGAQVIALEEVTAQALPSYQDALAKAYPYHTVQGTVGLWSKYPLAGTQAVDIKLGWTRALRTTVATPQGKVAVYVAHMPSVRVKLNSGFTASQRDKSADALGEAIADEPIEKVVLLGDLNGTMNDRALNGVTAQMRSTQGAAGSGFGFSWPAAFPMARIDQIMVKGVEPVTSWTLPATGSDHLPIAARVDL
ncbi:endonuclease/exonuclease/phosphatase family protein [Streptomyces sp. NBC_00006]|uniref:endonuclease/exonuclease/phosphatase family protein n=1 Tax=unclassified Streptomyces TaxID=2593676 RepID=UPI00225697EE|nr:MULTISPECIES: endonuclease/exonuclease/phosphatase family protein [unclassified Streptomyces]MCX5533918.1 endonuclease/exonuclease/phosphatase family protein [Streptomyces sp. NBC_00006]